MITQNGTLVTRMLNQLDHHPLNVRSVHEYEQSGGTVQTILELGKQIVSDGILSMPPLRAVAAHRAGERDLVFDGNRRLEGLLRLPAATRDSLNVQVILLPADTRPSDVIRLSITANENLKPSAWSKLRGMEGLIRLGTTKGSDLSAALKVSEAEISQFHKLIQLSPSIREAGERGLIAACQALEILKNDPKTGEQAILKYITEHPNESLTKARFELTKTADSARETALKATREYDAACERRKIAADNIKKCTSEEGKNALKLQIDATQQEMNRLAGVAKTAKETADKLDAVAKAKRKGGKGTGVKKASKGANKTKGTEHANFVAATEVLVGKAESFLTANFTGTDGPARRVQCMEACVKLLGTFRGKYLKT